MARVRKAGRARKGTAHRRETKSTNHDYSIFVFDADGDDDETAPRVQVSAIKRKWPSKAVSNKPHSRSRKRQHAKHHWLSDSASASSSGTDDHDHPPKRARGPPKRDRTEWPRLESFFTKAKEESIGRGVLKKHQTLIENRQEELQKPPGDGPHQDGYFGAEGTGWRQRFLDESHPLHLTYASGNVESESIMTWEAIVMNHINNHTKRSSKRGGVPCGVPLVGASFKSDSLYELSADIGEGCFALGSLQHFFEYHCRKTQTTVPESVAATISLDILGIVGEIHKHGITHNDLGLDSFLITKSKTHSGWTYRLALVGFGAKSRALGSNAENVGRERDSGDPFSADLVMVARLIWMLITGHHHFSVGEASGRRLLPWSLKSCVSLRAANVWEDILLHLLNPPSSLHGLHYARGSWEGLSSAWRELETCSGGLDWADQFRQDTDGTVQERFYDFSTKIDGCALSAGKEDPYLLSRCALLKTQVKELIAEIKVREDEIAALKCGGGSDDPEATKMASPATMDGVGMEEKVKESLLRAENEKAELAEGLVREVRTLRVRMCEELAEIAPSKTAKEKALETTREETASGAQHPEHEQVHAAIVKRAGLQPEYRELRAIISRNAGEFSALKKELTALEKTHMSALEMMKSKLEHAESKLKKEEKRAQNAIKEGNEKAAERDASIHDIAMAKEALVDRVAKLEAEKEQREREEGKAYSEAQRKCSSLETQVGVLRDAIDKAGKTRLRFENQIRRLETDLKIANGEILRWHKAERKLHYRTLNLQVRESQFKKALLKRKDQSKIAHRTLERDPCRED